MKLNGNMENPLVHNINGLRFNVQRLTTILMTEPFSNFSRFSTLTLMLSVLLVFDCGQAFSQDEQFGPPRPKAIKTPFGESSSQKSSEPTDSLGSISISTSSPLGRRMLSDRMRHSRMYLPDKMVLGRVAEFTVKGKPGEWVAIAMADKDKGSKPVLGHEVKLGPDRKVVATGQIPESGVAELLVECPVEGDLVGSYLYFEAAVWKEDNMKDTEIAQCVPSEGKGAGFNGVMIQPQDEQKKGVRIIPTTTAPFLQQAGQQGLSSPHP